MGSELSRMVRVIERRTPTVASSVSRLAAAHVRLLHADRQRRTGKLVAGHDPSHGAPLGKSARNTQSSSATPALSAAPRTATGRDHDLEAVVGSASQATMCQMTMLAVRDHFASARTAPGAISFLHNAIDLLSQFCVPPIAGFVGMVCGDGWHYERIDLATTTSRPARPPG